MDSAMTPLRMNELATEIADSMAEQRRSSGCGR